MLTIDEIKSVVTRIGQKYGIKNAYLFGSYAKNSASEDSDVDILIDRGDITTYKDYFHFSEDLKNSLGKEVDVTSEDGLLPGFFDLIKDDRILLYAA